MKSVQAELKENILNAYDLGKISENVCHNILEWTAPEYDESDQEELLSLFYDEKYQDIADLFFKRNEFGTAGVRGAIKNGSAFFNKYLLMQSVQGHAQFLKEDWQKHKESYQLDSKELATVLAYDSRYYSFNQEKDPALYGPGEFVKIAARIYAANGIKCYIMARPEPTPLLSFAVRESSIIRPVSGAVFTASHNPKTDNGYKPYEAYGGQVIDGTLKNIVANIKMADVVNIANVSFTENKNIVMLNQEIEKEYLRNINQLAINVSAIGKMDETKIETNIKIVHSALNGTSGHLVPIAMEQLGFKIDEAHFLQVLGQPDGSFSETPKPNPEDAQVIKKVIALASAKRADFVADALIINDPDADRLGIAVMHNGEYVLLDGNQQMILSVDYILSQLLEKKMLPNKATFIKTVVSTDMFRDVVEYYKDLAKEKQGLDIYMLETHVGFKYLGEKMDQFFAKAKAKMLDQDESFVSLYAKDRYDQLTRQERINFLTRFNENVFVYGGEESFGANSGDYVRDKDSIAVGNLMMEMIGFYKKAGKTLIERLDEIYQMVGIYEKDTVVKYEAAGELGDKIKDEIMHTFKKQPLQELNNKKVIAVINWEEQTAADSTGKILYDADYQGEYTLPNGLNIQSFRHFDGHLLPKSDVVMFYLDDGSKFVVRPSGTEPIVKIYASVRGTYSGETLQKEAVETFFNEAKIELLKNIESIADSVNSR